MLSALALVLLASSAVDAPADEPAGPPISAALEQSPYVVLAEIVESHDLAGATVEEATVTQVLKGSLDAGRIFYRIDSCGCGPRPTAPKAGSRVLLLLSPGSEVQERRSFWQALDRIARPEEFFEIVWGPTGRLVPDPNGFVTPFLALPESVPTRSVVATADATADAPVRRQVAFDVLLAWLQDHLAAAGAPLR